jgi:hypothetical protein
MVGLIKTLGSPWPPLAIRPQSTTEAQGGNPSTGWRGSLGVAACSKGIERGGGRSWARPYLLSQFFWEMNWSQTGLTFSATAISSTASLKI